MISSATHALKRCLSRDPLTLCFILTGLATLAPIWSVTWLPLQDLAGHIELMDVAHRADDPRTLYPEVYATTRPLDPNTLSLFLSQLLSPLVGVMVVTKLLLSFYALGLPIALRSVANSFGRNPWMSLLAFPLVFNALFNVGFINYLIALPLIFWTLPMARRLARSQHWIDALGLTLLLLLLFMAHVLAFLIGLALSLFILVLFGQAKGCLRTLLPTLPAVALLVLWMDRMFFHPVATELGRSFGTDQGMLWVYPTLTRRLGDLHTWGIQFFRDSTEEIALAAVAVIWLWAMTRRGTAVTHTDSEWPRWQALGQRRCLEIILLVTALAFLALPSGAHEISVLGERLALMLLLFLLLLPRSSWRPGARLLTPMLLLLVSYPFVVQAKFAAFDRDEAQPMARVIAQAAPKSRLAYVLRYPTSPLTFMRPSWHLPKGMHALLNGGVTHDSFALRPYTPVQYRPGQSPTRTRAGFLRSESIYEFDYLLVQANHAPHQLFNRPGVTLKANEQGLWLFEVRDPDRHATLVLGGNRSGFQDRFDCPPGMVIAGFSATSAGRLNTLTPFCRRHGLRSPAGKRTDRGPTFGRRNDAPNKYRAFCPQGSAVSGMSGRFGAFIQALTLHCQSLVDPASKPTGVTLIPGEGPSPFNAQCPSGSVATGYRGRSGLLIDGVGLSCHHPPALRLGPASD